MTRQAITLHLPENIYWRLQAISQVTHQPLEEVAFQAIQGNLPPLIEDLPLEWQADLAELHSLDNEALWIITKESLPQKQWQRHEALLDQNQSGTLTEAEQNELIDLRTAVDRFVIRRSYALALLKWRGYTLVIPETPAGP